MNLRISELLAIAAFVTACVFGSTQSLAHNAYITNQGDGTVSVIDTATNTVTATIPVGSSSEPFGVAVTPDGSKVYVADYGGDTVSVIDAASNTVTATIPVGADPTAFGIFIQPPPRFA